MAHNTMHPDFQLLFESSPGKILVLLPNFKIIAVSNTYLQATMTKREGIIGKGLFEVFPDNPDNPNATGVSNLRASLQRVLLEKVPDRMATQKYDIPRSEEEGSGFEERYWEPLNTPVLGAKGEILYIIHIVEDVTEVIKRSFQLDETRSIVEKLETERSLRERFVSTLSHDLKQPLTAAKTSAQMLARFVQDRTRITTLSGRIIDSLNRSEKMINNLLDANRINAGEKLPLEVHECDLVSVTNEVIEELRSIYGARFIIQSHGVLKGYWSAEGLRRIVENLCTNAIKYGDNIAPITVTVKLENANVAMISVHNHGQALSKDEINSIFEQFNRGSSKRSKTQTGWGLGLTLVRGLAKAHGGYVTVESAQEKGTSFQVMLPRDARSFEEKLGA